MKRYKIRPGSIADKAVKAFEGLAFLAVWVALTVVI